MLSRLQSPHDPADASVRAHFQSHPVTRQNPNVVLRHTAGKMSQDRRIDALDLYAEFSVRKRLKHNSFFRVFWSFHQYEIEEYVIGQWKIPPSNGMASNRAIIADGIRPCQGNPLISGFRKGCLAQNSFPNPSFPLPSSFAIPLPPYSIPSVILAKARTRASSPDQF